jgi:hypothetical protein
MQINGDGFSMFVLLFNIILLRKAMDSRVLDSFLQWVTNQIRAFPWIMNDTSTGIQRKKIIRKYTVKVVL